MQDQNKKHHSEIQKGKYELMALSYLLAMYFAFRLRMAKTLVEMVGNIGHSSSKWMPYWERVLPQPQ